MFDFEKLDVYQVVKNVNQKVLDYLYKDKKIDDNLREQLKKAVVNILINLAEGTGRIARSDKRHFYALARSAVFECVAIFDLLKDMSIIDEKVYLDFYDGFEQCSKMLLAMYRSMSGIKKNYNSIQADDSITNM